MEKNDIKIARDAVLYYAQKRVNKLNYASIPYHTLEGQLIDKRTIKQLIAQSIVHYNNTPLTNGELDELYEGLKNDEYFNTTDNGLEIIKVPLYFKLQVKYNIIVENIKEKTVPIALGTIIVGSLIGIPAIAINAANSSMEQWEKYENSQIITEEDQYNLKDIYVVYTTDKTYFCTRDIHKITEDDKVYGEFAGGYGSIDEYYYRDEIYDYYDIKTGEKICQDHEDGFYIEELKDFYDFSTMTKRDYKISLDEVSEEINNDYLLSRDPGLRRK